MTRLPRIRGKHVVRALERAGFVLVQTRGSHFYLKHADGRAVAVPLHAGEIIGPGLLRAILRESELTVDQLRALL